MADTLTDVIDTEQGSATGHFLPRKTLNIATVATAALLTMLLGGGVNAQGYRTGNSRAGRESLGTNCDYAVGANTQPDYFKGYGFNDSNITNRMNLRGYNVSYIDSRLTPLQQTKWHQIDPEGRPRDPEVIGVTQDRRGHIGGVLAVNCERYEECSTKDAIRLVYNYMIKKTAAEFWLREIVPLLVIRESGASYNLTHAIVPQGEERVETIEDMMAELGPNAARLYPRLSRANLVCAMNSWTVGVRFINDKDALRKNKTRENETKFADAKYIDAELNLSGLKTTSMQDAFEKMFKYLENYTADPSGYDQLISDAKRRRAEVAVNVNVAIEKSRDTSSAAGQVAAQAPNANMCGRDPEELIRLSKQRQESYKLKQQ